MTACRIQLNFVLRVMVGWFVVVAAGRALADSPPVGQAESSTEPPLRKHVSTVAQLHKLASAELFRGCDFSLTGVITLVDPTRELVILQDDAAAVALHFPVSTQPLQAGLRVTLTGTNATPGFLPFPAFPHRPSGREMLASFEFPMSPETYRLSRVRGYLCPPVTGDYSFWIASDNSSELWLSTSADPAKVRNIASIPRYGWVNPLEWSRYPSQASEPIRLQADTRYYIEVLQEQTTGGEHLAVAWQGPDFGRRIIGAAHLIPWNDFPDATASATHGVWREFWTNYFAGDLAGLGGPRPFEAVLTVPTVQVQVHERGAWPELVTLALDQRLPARDNFRWGQVEGIVTFQTSDDQFVNLELTAGSGQVQVRMTRSEAELLRGRSNVLVRVTGVCEGVVEQKGTVTPGLVWATGENCLTIVATAGTNDLNNGQTTHATAATVPVVQGFYSTRGVVTFNDRFGGKDYTFVQENSAPAFVRLEDESFRPQFSVGKLVDLGGAFDASQSLPIITPLVVTDLGIHALPAPIQLAPGGAAQGLRDGRWCELEGVVQAVNPDGTLTVVGPDGHAFLWIGQTPTNSLADFVDARLRARGVILLKLLDKPLLLSPARTFVEVQTAAPMDAFGLPVQRIADLLAEDAVAAAHRVHVTGVVTYRMDSTFFLQDGSGGIRVRSDEPLTVSVGDAVAVVAFPARDGFARLLTRAQMRLATRPEPVQPRELDLTEALSARQNGSLVRVDATLLTQKTTDGQLILELQKQSRVFVATLAADLGPLPEFKPGSQLRVIGVCDDDTSVMTAADEKSLRNSSLAALHLLLRTPADVIVLRGPPWWTWQRTALLVGALVLVLVVALSWVHLLRRRLERQQAAQLAFSRQVLKRLEDERRRIAVNLHDSLGQILLLIKNHALLALQPAPDETGARQRLNEISTATSQAIEEVREITHGLRPYQLDRLGLTQAIRTSVQQAAVNNAISFACRVEDVDGLFDQDTEIHVYRIVQEAVTNVVKHAAATEATVVVKRRPDAVSLSIRDNGRGFEAVQLAAHPHELGYGLTGIGERARILGATLEIDSRPNGGTSLMVEIPLPVYKL